MGRFCPGGFCPGEFCPRGILSRGILSGGFVWGDFVLEPVSKALGRSFMWIRKSIGPRHDP